LFSGWLYGSLVYEVRMPVEIRTSATVFVSMPFLFDTGTHFTTLAIADARQFAIPFSTTRPVTIQSAPGKGSASAYLSPLWFSFRALPQWQFQTQACFTPYPLRRSLLSLSDVLANFTLRTGPRTAAHPGGSLILRLRHNHQGQTRP